MTCERCGHPLAIGDFPFCKGSPAQHGPMRQAIETNEAFIGGLTLENLGPEPVTVYSREEYKLAMARAGVEQHIKWVPGDRHLQNWGAYIDPYTMAAAKALVERQ